MKWRFGVKMAGAMLVMAGVACTASCAHKETADDGPARALSRLPRNIQLAAEGYVESLHGLATSLAGVTDTPSARSALPGLEDHLARLNSHRRVLEAAEERVQADAKYAFYRSLSSADRRFDAQVSRVKGTPGVGSVLTPLLDKIPRWR